MLSSTRHGIRVAGHKRQLGSSVSNTLLSCSIAAGGSAGFMRLSITRMHLHPLSCPYILGVSTIGDLWVEQTTPIGEGLPAVVHRTAQVITVEASTFILLQKRFAFIGIRGSTRNGDDNTTGLVASQSDVCSCGFRGRPRIKVRFEAF